MARDYGELSDVIDQLIDKTKNLQDMDVKNEILDVDSEDQQINKYRQFIITKFSEYISEELTACIWYIKSSYSLKNKDLEYLLQDIAYSEYKHYTMFIKYAFYHNFNANISINIPNSINDNLESKDLIIDKILNMEQESINDYIQVIKLAETMEDFETIELFKNILSDEYNHVERISLSTNRSREINE